MRLKEHETGDQGKTKYQVRSEVLEAKGRSGRIPDN